WLPHRVRTAHVPRRAEGDRDRREDRPGDPFGSQRGGIRPPGTGRRHRGPDPDPGHRQEDRRAHRRRAARPGRRPHRRRRCGGSAGVARRPASGGGDRAAATGLQAGRGDEDGTCRHRPRRRGRRHHPQGATVRAPLTTRPRLAAQEPMTPSRSAHAGGAAAASSHDKAGLAGLVLGAIGVVFGDIGTSPLYTLKLAFAPHYGLVADHDTVLGILSLVFWALTLVVTVKYVSIITRADNEGEGGIMALMALAQRTLAGHARSSYLVGLLGVFGAALFFGDGVITPAISVLSALEGIEVVAPELGRWVVSLTVLVLAGLFATQRFGSGVVGKVFGPITGLWFLVLAVLGVANILHEPEVLQAINPLWAARFFVEHSWGGVFIL